MTPNPNLLRPSLKPNRYLPDPRLNQLHSRLPNLNNLPRLNHKNRTKINLPPKRRVLLNLKLLLNQILPNLQNLLPSLHNLRLKPHPSPKLPKPIRLSQPPALLNLLLARHSRNLRKNLKPPNLQKLRQLKRLKPNNLNRSNKQRLGKLKRRLLILKQKLLKQKLLHRKLLVKQKLGKVLQSHLKVNLLKPK
uniref:Uncharacterized protein n=1 Tax=Arcella intermedia TaxID=1963864 RepID=A0A6B2L726_9EUKA